MKAKAQAAPDFKVCPACGTRNKVAWEFCARCGESLVEVAPGLPPGAAPEPAAAPAAAAAGGSNPIVGALVVAFGIALVVIGYRYSAEQKPPAEPDGSVFAFPTLAPALPSPPVVRDDPAARLYAEGLARLQRKDAKGALAPLSEAVSLAGNKAEYRLAYGKALWLSGDKQSGLREMEGAANADPRPALLMELAKAYDEIGQRNDALGALRRLLEAEPDDLAALQLAASLEQREGRPAQAVAYLKRLLEKNPEDVVSRQALGAAQEKAGDTDAAMDTYREVLSRRPDAVVTRGLLAEMLFKQGKKEESVELFREGVKVQPDNPLVHRGLGSVLERSGQWGEAAQEYMRYAQLAPNAADAQQLTERAGKLEKAASPSPAP